MADRQGGDAFGRKAHHPRCPVFRDPVLVGQGEVGYANAAKYNGAKARNLVRSSPPIQGVPTRGAGEARPSLFQFRKSRMPIFVSELLIAADPRYLYL